MLGSMTVWAVVEGIMLLQERAGRRSVLSPPLLSGPGAEPKHVARRVVALGLEAAFKTVACDVPHVLGLCSLDEGAESEDPRVVTKHRGDGEPSTPRVKIFDGI